eukprot:g5018.t1
MDEGKDRRRERHVIRRYPLASMSVTQFGESQESTTDVSSVTSTRGVVRSDPLLYSHDTLLARAATKLLEETIGGTFSENMVQ